MAQEVIMYPEPHSVLYRVPISKLPQVIYQKSLKDIPNLKFEQIQKEEIDRKVKFETKTFPYPTSDKPNTKFTEFEIESPAGSLPSVFDQDHAIDQVYYRDMGKILKNKQELKEKKLEVKYDTKPDILADDDGALVQKAYDLSWMIGKEWDNIILARRDGDFEHDLKVEYNRNDYYDQTVYDRAWEVNDLIQQLIDVKQSRTVLFKDYEKKFVEIQKPENRGKDACRKLLSMSQLLSKVVHKRIKTAEIETVDSIVPESASGYSIRG